MNNSNPTNLQGLQLPGNKIFTGVDAIKYIMAIFVILIHVSAIMKIDPPVLITWLMRLAVPFFFISSGWFLSKKLNGTDVETQRKILLHRTISLLKLFFAWTLIYFPISIAVYIVDKSSSENFVYFLCKCIGRTIIIGEPHYAWPLWFIHALIIGCFILFLLVKNQKLTKAVMWLFIGNIFIFWLNNVPHITPPIFSSPF